MNWFPTIIYKYSNPFKINKLTDKLCLLVTCLLVLPLVACIDEDLTPCTPGATGANDITLTDLPGVFGIYISADEDLTTRADNQSADGKPFDDGNYSEYRLATPDENNGEYYHYLILSNTNANKRFIFPIDINTKTDDSNRTNNWTLSVSRMFSKGAKGDEEFNAFENVAEMSAFLANTQPYVLLNFKLDDAQAHSALEGSNLPEGSTADKLMKMSTSELEKLRMNDYKVKLKRTATTGDNTTEEYDDFFIMSSSVYSSGGKKKFDGTFYTDRIFSKPEQARANPSLSVHVERIASKISVSFDINKMLAVGNAFGPNANWEITEVRNDENTGLPIINLNVEKVDMGSGGDNGIVFNEEEGYYIKREPVPATITILGFGVSNLETSTDLFKNISSSYSTGNWSWNDPSNFRSYWSEDPHYAFETSTNTNVFNDNSPFSKVKGYPHQFRLALDSDSVTSYHGGKYDGNDKTEYQLDDENYVVYDKLGTMDQTDLRQGVYLKYKSFEQLQGDYENIRHYATTSDGKTSYSFDPIYTFENTYADQGMIDRQNWRWRWERAPYAAATNLMVLAKIEFEEPFNYEDKTVYLGQNDIFYLKKENFLKSKLTILNKVMLSGGNAGIQILKGQWDRHKPGENNSQLLDKVAWNEGSVLWFVKTATEEINDKKIPVYEKVESKEKDENGKPIMVKRVVFSEEPIMVPETNDVTKYLDLIPAEISGGDGQRLIAPHEDYMGVEWRYYLAPPIIDTNGTTIDRDKAFEISFNHLVALIHKIIGPVDVFTDGYMYFSVPIPHRYDSNKVNAMWTQLGGYSIVRNNWYNITVTDITKLGTPVDEPGQPIVPVMDVKRSYINMGVKLKDWHEIIQDNIPMM